MAGRRLDTTRRLWFWKTSQNTAAFTVSTETHQILLLYHNTVIFPQNTVQFSLFRLFRSDGMMRSTAHERSSCRFSPTRGVVQCLHVVFVMSSLETLQIYSLRRINITESTSFIHESNLIMMTCSKPASIFCQKTSEESCRWKPDRVDWMHFTPTESIKASAEGHEYET